MVDFKYCAAVLHFGGDAFLILFNVYKFYGGQFLSSSSFVEVNFHAVCDGGKAITHCIISVL